MRLDRAPARVTEPDRPNRPLGTAPAEAIEAAPTGQVPFAEYASYFR